MKMRRYFQDFLHLLRHRQFRRMRRFQIQIVRTRVDLVATKTSIKNKVHAILAKYDYSCPTNDIFSQKNNTMAKTVDLSWIDRMAVDAYVETMFVIEKQVRKNRLKYLQQRLHPYQKKMKE